MNDPVVIVGAARTPMGAFQGDFSSKTASDLGAVAIQAAVQRAGEYACGPELLGSPLHAQLAPGEHHRAAVSGGELGRDACLVLRQDMEHVVLHRLVGVGDGDV